MADVIDLDKKREEKEEEEAGDITVYPCICGSMFWVKTNVGDMCGFCDTPFEWLEFEE